MLASPTDFGTKQFLSSKAHKRKILRKLIQDSKILRQEKIAISIFFSFPLSHVSLFSFSAESAQGI